MTTYIPEVSDRVLVERASGKKNVGVVVGWRKSPSGYAIQVRFEENIISHTYNEKQMLLLVAKG